MAKTKRLTNEQCKPLFDIMYTHTRKAISEALNYASEHEDYDPGEVKIFIRNHFEVTTFMTDAIIDKIVRGQISQLVDNLARDIDFPNSAKSSENIKSSNTINEREV